MRPLASAIRTTLAALGIRRSVARAAALAAWRDSARACLGPEADRTSALRIEEGTLVVGVPSPVLAQELRLRAAEVLAELRRRAPESGVEAVRFVPR